ncbi:MAG: 5-bromo-4-chloroindolyl phosphate hydrolysis family protein [Pseudomonadota bacterium]
MAQRFGGKYSPDGSAKTGVATRSPLDGKRPTRAGFRSNLLFLLPFPFLVSAFRGDPTALALNLACFAALLLAAWLTRDGILAQEAYEARTVARRPAIPRKIFGSVLTGLGLAVAGIGDGSLANAVIFAGLGFVLHLAAFGPDPLSDKGMEGTDRFQSDRVARAVDEAEKHLSDMADGIKRAGDRRLEGRVERFAGTAREMFRTVEQDPRDLTAARKFLGVYLLAARDATVKFADIYSRNRDGDALKDYEELLDDLEAKFSAKTETLLLDDRSDLNVEIEVLRERLERENL